MSTYYRLNRLIAYVFVLIVQVEVVALEHWLCKKKCMSRNDYRRGWNKKTRKAQMQNE